MLAPQVALQVAFQVAQYAPALQRLPAGWFSCMTPMQRGLPAVVSGTHERIGCFLVSAAAHQLFRTWGFAFDPSGHGHVNCSLHCFF